MKNIAIGLLNEEQKSRVRQAISELEMVTSGEVVVAMIDSARPYYRVGIQAGLVVTSVYTVVAGLAIAIFSLMSDHIWSSWISEVTRWHWWIAAAPLVFIAGVWAGGTRSFASRIVAKAERQMAAEQRAETIFIQHRVFETSQATGILLAGFLFERTALVYGDRAVNEAISPDQWQQTADRLVTGLRTGSSEQITLAYIEALDGLKTLLADKLPEPQVNVDELPNEFVVE